MRVLIGAGVQPCALPISGWVGLKVSIATPTMGVQPPPVVLAESVGLQDAVITSFSGAGGGGKKVSVVLAESVGLQDSIATPTIGVPNPPEVLAELVGLSDAVINSLS